MIDRRRRRQRGAVAVEYLVLLLLVVVAGLLVTTDMARALRCKMAAGPDAQAKCGGSANVQLKPADDGCIGVVCKDSGDK